MATTAISEAIAAVRRGGVTGLWLPMALVTLAACLLAACAAATARETYKPAREGVGASAAEPSGSTFAVAA